MSRKFYWEFKHFLSFKETQLLIQYGIKFKIEKDSILFERKKDKEKAQEIITKMEIKK